MASKPSVVRKTRKRMPRTKRKLAEDIARHYGGGDETPLDRLTTVLFAAELMQEHNVDELRREWREIYR